MSARPLEPGPDDQNEAPALRAVTDDEPPGDPRPECRLSNGPANALWLRNRVGAGPLSGVFWRGSRLVRTSAVGEEGYVAPLHAGQDNGPVTVGPLSKLALSAMVTDAYRVLKVTVDKETRTKVETPAHFPLGDVAQALELPEKLPYVRALRGVTTTPIARADKGVVTAPGYDDASGFLHLPEVDVPAVPENPTDERVAAATTYLRDLVAEFSWADEHSEANFWGAMLTPLLRLACPPPYKLVIFTARAPGSGKGLLARLLRIVHGGGLRPWPERSEEVEKMLVAVLLTTTGPVVQIDNVRGVLQSSHLEALATSATYSGRVLGASEETSQLPNDRLWTFTSNNAQIGGDLSRRSLLVDIDPGVENPELRTGFRHPHLARTVAAQRGYVLAALHTWIAAWDARGRPTDTAATTSDDYGGWVAAVRAILGIAGVPGTFDEGSSARAAAHNPEEVEFGEFLAAVVEVMGAESVWTVRALTAAMELSAVVQSGNGPSLNPQTREADERAQRLREALPTDLADKLDRARTPRSIAKSLGRWLDHRDGRFYAGRAVRNAGRDAHTKVALWKVTERAQ